MAIALPVKHQHPSRQLLAGSAMPEHQQVHHRHTRLLHCARGGRAGESSKCELLAEQDEADPNSTNRACNLAGHIIGSFQLNGPILPLQPSSPHHNICLILIFE